MARDDNYSVSFEIETTEEAVHIEVGPLRAVPREGEVVACNYVHGTKIEFRVDTVEHFLYSSGKDIIQMVTVKGREV